MRQSPYRPGAAATKILHRTALVPLLLCSAACGSMLARQLNTSPPDPSVDRAKAVAATAEALAEIESPSVYVGVATGDLAAGLLASLPRETLFSLPLSESGPTVDGRAELTNLRVEGGEQDLVLKAEYWITATTPKLRFRVRATAHVLPYLSTTPSTRSITLSPQTQLTHLRVDRVRIPGFPSGTLKAAANAILDYILPSINDQLSQQTVTLATADLPPLSPDALFKQRPPGLTVSGSSLIITPVVDTAAILVDEAGLHALADLTVATRTGVAPLMEADYDAVRERFLELATLVDVSEDSPEDRFWARSGLAVSKRLVADSLNRAANHLELCAHYDPGDTGPFPFHDRLRFEPARDIGCGAIANRSCSISRSCDPIRNCNPGWPCPNCDCRCRIDWGGIRCEGNCDPTCPAVRAGCEIDKTRFRAQCELEKAGAKALCEAGKEAERVACEADKAVSAGACNLFQDLVNRIGGSEYAVVKGNLTMNKTAASLCVNSFAADTDLSHLSMVTTVSARTHLDAYVDVEPLNLGYIGCLTRFGGPLNADVVVPEQSLVLRSTLDYDPNGGSPVLRFSAQVSDSLSVAVDPPPAGVLLQQLPHTFLACPLVIPLAPFAAVLSPTIANDLMQRNYEFSLPPFQSEFPLPQLGIEVGRSPIPLQTSWRQRSIRFEGN